MGWLTHLHGWRALEVAWTVTAVPLWVGLFQQRPPLTKWLLSPITTTVCLVIAAIVTGAYTAHAAGFHWHYVKPVDPEKLKGLLANEPPSQPMSMHRARHSSSSSRPRRGVMRIH